MDTPPYLALAERVAQIASALGVETALIGAAALAAHNFVRATEDIDLGAYLDSFEALRHLEDRLLAAGLKVRLTFPDDQDDLGGVLRVWEREDGEGDPIEPVEIVNFYNPLRPRRHPGVAAVRSSTPLSPGTPLRVVGLAELIAMKLATGSPWDKLDVVGLIEHNPDADPTAIRAACEPWGLAAAFDELLEPEP